MLFSKGWGAVCTACTVLVLVMGHFRPAHANETDQFLLPTDKEFFDLGPVFNANHYRVLNQVVERANRRIDRALAIRDPERREAALRKLHQPEPLADRVRWIFGAGFFEMNLLESVLHSNKYKKKFPDHILAHRNLFWIYADVHLPFDPRKLILTFHSSTIKVYGSYLGTDKIGHFHDLGHIYYKHYRGKLKSGMSEEEALASTVNTFSRGPISEGAVIGRFATGVYSNADLASNYFGMKFYLNLVEPVRMGDEVLPPLLVRDGPYWRLNDHVGKRTDFMKPFFTDHWNEALNPNVYEWGMRGSITRRLRKEADRVLTVYADEHGRPRPREWFEQKVYETATVYGEDYGHSGFKDGMISIASHCFPDEPPLRIQHARPQLDAAEMTHAVERD